MRILVAQLARMGDVLQTSPLIRALKRKHPDAHITVMVRRMGKPVAERNPDIDDVIVYEEDSMFLDMRSGDSDRFLRAYERAEGYITSLKQGRFEVCYNCTSSVASAILLKAAEIPEVIGVHIGQDGQFMQRGSWTRYFFTSVFNRKYNDFNLCDMFRNFLPDAPPVRNLVFNVTDEDRGYVAALFQRHGVTSDDFVACFQLGASQEGKRWSEVHFASLGGMLVQRRNAHIFLVGLIEEAPLGESFADHAPGIAIPLYGQTTIPQLAALLERANVLVTNDTGTMHLGAATACPTVLVSVGNVHFRETGPYGGGHCAVEYRRPVLGTPSLVPGALEERSKLLPKQVMRAVDVALSAHPSAPIPQVDESAEVADVDIHISGFDPAGCLTWYPVIRRPLTETDLLRIAYRAMWLDHLGTQKDSAAEQKGLDATLRCYNGPEPSVVRQWCDRLAPVFEQLAELAQRGITATEVLLETLRTQSYAAAKERVGVLTRLDEEIRLFGQLHEASKPLVRISRFERDNLEGIDPRALAQCTLGIYHDLADRAQLTIRKLRQVAEAFCPTEPSDTQA